MYPDSRRQNIVNSFAPLDFLAKETSCFNSGTSYHCSHQDTLLSELRQALAMILSLLFSPDKIAIAVTPLQGYIFGHHCFRKTHYITSVVRSTLHFHLLASVSRRQQKQTNSPSSSHTLQTVSHPARHPILQAPYLTPHSPSRHPP